MMTIMELAILKSAFIVVLITTRWPSRVRLLPETKKKKKKQAISIL